MKKLYRILYILPIAILMIGCDNSDDINDVLTTTTTATSNTVFIETDDAAVAYTLVSLTDANTINLAVNTAVTSPLTPGFTVTRVADGTTAVEGTDYTIAVNAFAEGATTSTADVSFLTDGKYKVTLNSSSDTAVNAAGNSAYFSTDSGSYSATLTWQDDTVDLNLDLDLMTSTWGWAFVTFDSSDSSTPTDLTENVSLSSVAGEGNLALWFWGNGNTEVDYTIELRDDELGELVGTYTGTFPADTNAWRLWFSIGADANGNSSIVQVYETNPAN